MLPFSSCYIKISAVSQCRILVPVQYMKTQLFAFLFLTACTMTCWTAQWIGYCLHWLTQTEIADWQQMHELASPETQTQSWNWLRELPHSTHRHTGCTMPTNSILLAAAAAASTRAKLLQPQPPYHHDTMHKKCYLWDLQETQPLKLPNQNSLEIPLQTSKALFGASSKLLKCTSPLNMLWTWPEDGSRRYVLFFIITSEIITAWQSV